MWHFRSVCLTYPRFKNEIESVIFEQRNTVLSSFLKNIAESKVSTMVATRIIGANMLVATSWSRLTLVVTSQSQQAGLDEGQSRPGSPKQCWSRLFAGRGQLVATSASRDQLVATSILATSWSQLSWLRPWSRLSIPL